ncbi:MAG: WD40 repeat domain-containing protein [Candidatus Thorarchaeota archaeon]|nr:WD40 repeat domain-containing protein [Candidatus Thorarchaeota archaeon]
MVISLTIGTLYRPSAAAPSPITSLSVDKRGKTIACGTMDSDILLLDATSGRPKRALKGHEAMVSSVTFAKGGKSILSASWDHTTRKWTVHGADKAASPIKHKAEVKLVVVDDSSSRGVSGARNGVIKLFSVDSLRCFRIIQAHRNDISGLAFGHDSSTLVTSSWDGECKLWDLTNYEMIQSLVRLKERIRSLALSPDDSRFYLGLHSGRILSIDFADECKVTKLKGHEDIVTSLALNPSGTMLASASWDRKIKIWSTSTGKEKAQRRLLTGASCIAWTPDGSAIFASDFSGAILNWPFERK